MVEYTKVQSQLSKVGYRAKLFQKAEVRELCNVLHEDEVILQATNGYYEGGFSLLVATDHRILLIDRKPMFLTLDSIAYSMIQEVTFNYRLLNSTIHIYTSNKCLDFNSWNHAQIRAILSISQKMMRKLPKSNYASENYSPADNLSYEINRGQSFTNIDQSLPEERQLEPQLSRSVPDIDIEDVPTMPNPLYTPHFLNDNTESAYEQLASSVQLPLNNSSGSFIDPSADVNEETTQPVLGQRQYARRYF